VFAYIAKENKALLNIDNDILDMMVHSPDLHLEQQLCEWGKRWHVADKDLDVILNKLLQPIIIKWNQMEAARTF